MKLASAGLDFPKIPGAFSDDSHTREGIMQKSRSRAANTHARQDFYSVIYIGDGVWDARACRALGWPFIGIAHDPDRNERLRAGGAREVFASYAQGNLFLDALTRHADCL